MINKLTLSTLLWFFPYGYELAYGMGISTIYSMIVFILRPMLRKGDDRLQLLANTELYLFMLIGYVNREVIEIDGNTDVMLTIIMISLTMGLALFFLTQGMNVLKKFCKNRNQAKKDKEEADAKYLAKLEADEAKRKAELEKAARNSIPVVETQVLAYPGTTEGTANGNTDDTQPGTWDDSDDEEATTGWTIQKERGFEEDSSSEDELLTRARQTSSHFVPGTTDGQPQGSTDQPQRGDTNAAYYGGEGVPDDDSEYESDSDDSDF